MSDPNCVVVINFQAKIEIEIRDGEVFISQENRSGDDDDIIQVAPENLDRLIAGLQQAKSEFGT